MKNLIFVNGTMGVGKTSTCHELLEILQSAVFLDGDWCWYMNPFIVTEESKKMVVANIVHNLRSFLNCSVYENIIFCWVMHKEEIMDDILNQLNDLDYLLHKFTLVASKETLTKRINRDIEAGLRAVETREKSLNRIDMYENMNTRKIDVNEITSMKAAIKIREHIGKNNET